MEIHFSEESQVALGGLVSISPKAPNGHTWDADRERGARPTAYHCN